MRKLITLVFISLSFVSFARAQAVAPQPTATQPLQQSESAKSPESTLAAGEIVEEAKPAAPGPATELKIPSGTPIEVEAAYTVSSVDIKPGHLLSFRVVIPIVIDGVTVIENGALVTARVILAKRGGHWGRAGKLAWSMEDVVGVDNTRIPLAPETRMRNEALWNLETKGKNNQSKMGQGSVTGTSHGGEVATKTIVTAAIMPFLAPLALMHGFKRGENAVLWEGRRFVVTVRNDANVKVAPRRTD